MLPSIPYSRERELEGLRGEGAETVEPILDSFGGYSTDNLSNFYYPYIIVLLMIFRDEVRNRHEDHPKYIKCKDARVHSRWSCYFVIWRVYLFKPISINHASHTHIHVR